LGSWQLPSAEGPEAAPQDDRDQERVREMGKLLAAAQEGYQKYKELCASAKNPPAIGMTKAQARATTWCYPHDVKKTATAAGLLEQEIYLSANGSITEPPRYLYFENGILTAIQE
jgi:hypothetical protein